MVLGWKASSLSSWEKLFFILRIIFSSLVEIPLSIQFIVSRYCLVYSIFNLSLALALYSFETIYLDMKFSVLLALFCISVNFYLLPLGNSQLLIFQAVLQHYLLEGNSEVFTAVI